MVASNTVIKVHLLGSIYNTLWQSTTIIASDPDSSLKKKPKKPKTKQKWRKKCQALFIKFQSLFSLPHALPGEHQPSSPTTHTPGAITVPSFILEPKKSGKFPIELMVTLWVSGASQISLIHNEMQSLSLW